MPNVDRGDSAGLGYHDAFRHAYARAEPRRLAYELEDELGIRVYAAHDGWTLDLENELV